MTEELPLFAEPGAPLAERMRPRRLEEFVGQEHLLGPGKPLREAIERGTVGSLVFWGPPGCGKTTLARLIAEHTDKAFEIFSAVTEGVPRVREIIREARARRESEGRGTILFCDEIHRFNKAQQDAFLPSVEAGVITLIGATTENPSFELNSALLSRLRVFVLEPLDEAAIRTIVERALARLAAEAEKAAEKGSNRFSGDRASDESSVQPENRFDPFSAAAAFSPAALEVLARHADGDGRRALNATEAVWQHLTAREPPLDEPVSAELVQSVLERRVAFYDKGGEQHYNVISALHKAVRGSDVEGALYWFARMIDGGEDPLYIARRLVRMAVEDIGLADPRALTLTIAAKDAYHFLGSPEGELALAEAVIFLATAPKSNAVYAAWGHAQQAAREHPAEPVPLHIRNAPTRLMKGLGYGKSYRYDHAEGGHAAGQEYLPEPLRGAEWYQPAGAGFEKTIAERLDWWKKRRRSDA